MGIYSTTWLKSRLSRLVFLFSFLFVSFSSQAQTFTTLDDFSDGNFITNLGSPWNILSGSWQINSGVLQKTGLNGTYRIATPFSRTCNAWEFRFDLDGSGFSGQRIEYYFFMTSASSNPSTANGYRVSYNLGNTTAENTIRLERVTNGAGSTIVSFSNISGDQNIRVTRDNNQWSLFAAGVLRGTGTDATYSLSECAFQGGLIFIPSTSIDYNHGFDNIRYSETFPPSIFESFAILNSGSSNQFYDLGASTGNPDLNNANLGTFNSGQQLTLVGGENKIFKCPPFDVITGTLFYRIYRSGTTPEQLELIEYSPVDLGKNVSNIGAALCPGGQDQSWQNTEANINLLSGLCDGSYVLEIYNQAEYNTGIGTPSTTVFANNGGANYKANFTVNNSDLSGIFESYVVLNSGSGNTFYNLAGSPNSILTNFQGFNLGSFCQNGSLIIAGGENKTFECPPNNVFNGKLFYKIYSGTGTSVSFSQINLSPLAEDIGATICPGGENQKWQNVSNATNILTGLTPGTYTIEVFTQADYNTNGICPGTHFSNNGGANYKATFTVVAPTIYYQDSDGDGYGNAAVTQSSCSGAPAGYVADNTDCNDANASVNPGAIEVCNNIDDDCDGQLDEGVRPARPEIACWQTATFNEATCQWDITGTQPTQPTGLACWQSTSFNSTTCEWEVTGTQPQEPAKVNCWDNYEFNTTECAWVNTGSQPQEPAKVNCWDNYVFNTTECAWVNTGSQPQEPVKVNCWDNYVFNTTECAWVNTGSQPQKPEKANCWDMFVFIAEKCEWVNVGVKPLPPASLNCWDNFVYNNDICDWVNIGTKPQEPAKVNCWDNFVFDSEECTWINTVTQPEKPTGLACWETAVFDNTICQWNINEIELDAPTITAPADLSTTTSADGLGNCTTTATLGTPIIGNGCGIVSVTNDAPAVFSTGVTNVTWTVTNRSGKSATAIQKVTVVDNEKPSIECTAAIIDNTDPGLCTRVINLTLPDASDNCGIATNGITGVRSDGLPLTSPYPLGLTTITWTATDVNGNQSAACLQNVIISKVNAVVSVTSVSVMPGEQQYSDRVNFTATVTPDGCLSAGNLQGSVVFRIGSQVMGSAPVIGGVATLSGVPLLEPLPRGTLPVEQLVPGLKTVTAALVNTSADYITFDGSTTFTITKENAVVDYTGQEFASTGSSTGTTASVRLAASVRDITAVNPASDPDAGYIANAKARFIIRALDPTTMSVVSTTNTRWLNVSVTGADFRVGAISLDTVFNIGSNNSQHFEIGVEVDSFYTSSTNSIGTLVVSRSLTDFVTFGGHLLMRPNTSAGLYPSNAGSRVNFTGHAMPRKNADDLKGGINMIWRSGSSVYQMRGRISRNNGSLSVQRISSTRSEAILTAAVRITENRSNGQVAPNTSGSVVTFRLQDNGEPGSLDSIAIEVRNGAGVLIFSTYLINNVTEERVLNGGNIQIHRKGNTAVTRRANDEPMINSSELFDLNVLSNPTVNQFGIQLKSSDMLTRMTLRVLDLNGRLVEQFDQLRAGQVLQIGHAYNKGIYFAELIQGDQRKVVRLLKN